MVMIAPIMIATGMEQFANGAHETFPVFTMARASAILRQDP
jgi:hypothetical protein